MHFNGFLLFFLGFAGTILADSVDNLLSRYNRPFTLLSIGKNVGYFVAEKSPCYLESTFVILEKAPGNEKILSSQKNVIWMNHKLLFSEVQDLTSCEHVDILLLSNSLPMFCPNWDKALKLFQRMAHRVIVQLPNEQTEYLDPMHTYLLQQSVEVYKEGSLISYILESHNPFHLAKTTLIHPRKMRWSYEIYCDYSQKYLKKVRPHWTVTNPWIPGINMMTFLIYNGTIPSRSQILAHLPLDPQHNDWVPNNMIVQGSDILLIDKEDPVSGAVIPDGGERFRNMEAKLRTFISTTANLSPPKVRENFISIYNWGKYFDQTEIEE